MQPRQIPGCTWKYFELVQADRVNPGQIYKSRTAMKPRFVVSVAKMLDNTFKFSYMFLGNTRVFTHEVCGSEIVYVFNPTLPGD